MLGPGIGPVLGTQVVQPLPPGEKISPRPPTANASVEPIVNGTRASLPRPGRIPAPKQVGAGIWKSLKHCVGIVLISLARTGAISFGTGTCGTVPSNEITRPPTDD